MVAQLNPGARAGSAVTDRDDGAQPRADSRTSASDLAAVEAARQKPDEACAYAEQAMDQLAVTWYATGMDRILDVRKALQPWADTEAVHRLDDRIYGWQTTLRALQR